MPRSISVANYAEKLLALNLKPGDVVDMHDLFTIPWFGPENLGKYLRIAEAVRFGDWMLFCFEHGTTGDFSIRILPSLAIVSRDTTFETNRANGQ